MSAQTSAPTPEWAAWAIGWHVYPLGFLGAPVHDKADHPPQSRLPELKNWLPYVQQQGFNLIQLAPIFESTTHGYDTEDYFQIDSRLGSEADLVDFLNAAHERGIKVLFDGVFNHIGAQAPALKEALANPDAPAAELFALQRTEHGLSAAVFEGHDSLVEFDHSHPATAEFVIEVMDYWLQRGVDGWRLDAAYAVDPAFWAKVLPEVRRRHPNAYIYGEVIHGDYPHIVAESGMDSVTEYELWKAIWSALKEENFFELEWTLKRHNVFLDSFVPVTFVGNHDVTRIATQVGPDKAVLAAAVLFSVGGLPLVYYGDEQGYTGLKEERVGGDDQIRPQFPQSPEDFSPLGHGINTAYQQLISMRRRFPWLHTARTEVVEVRNGYLHFLARSQESTADFLRIELNIEGNQVSATVRSAQGAEEFGFSS